MKVVIYSNSSLGGCYEYAKQIAAEYSRNAEVEWCKALFPKGSAKDCAETEDILLKDRMFRGVWKLFGKIYFLYRSLINPIRAYKYATKNKADLLIFNDFDQVTSYFWTRRYRRRKFKTAIILHDPDRTAYFHRKSLSESTMQRIMDIVDIAFYHEKLPPLPYYENKDNRIIFSHIPHGIYPPAEEDKDIAKIFQGLKSQGLTTLSITGNIRAEKNYKIAIDAIAQIPDTVLIIAGRSVTVTENVDTYRQYAKENGVENRVIFIEKYLNNNELSAVFANSDIILLYYSTAFKSQSGILNSLSPYKPKLIVSDTESGMAQSVKKFGIARLAAPDSVDALIDAIKTYPQENPYTENWQKFADYSSWGNNIAIQISTYNQSVTKNENA